MTIMNLTVMLQFAAGSCMIMTELEQRLHDCRGLPSVFKYTMAACQDEQMVAISRYISDQQLCDVLSMDVPVCINLDCALDLISLISINLDS